MSMYFINPGFLVVTFCGCLCRADWTFLEAPRSEAEMIEYCSRVKGPKLANMLEGGDTPIITPARLQEIGIRHTLSFLHMLSN